MFWARLGQTVSRHARPGLVSVTLTCREKQRKEPAERGEAGWRSQPADPLSPLHIQALWPFSRMGTEEGTCPGWEHSGAGLLSPDLGGGADRHLCLGGNVGAGEAEKRSAFFLCILGCA